MNALRPIPFALGCLAGVLVQIQTLEAADSRQEGSARGGATRIQSQTRKSTPSKSYPTFGSVDRRDPGLDALLAPDARMEKLAEGFTWSEGPVWRSASADLLFSDVPKNRIHRWSETDGLSVFLEPSGYTGRALQFREPGSNGLATDRAGNLLVCQHGDRRISRLRSDGTFEPLAEFVNGRRLNSPNDLCVAANGDIYFTDPPYGHEGLDASPLKELLFNGVYLRRRNGELVLLTDRIPFPNGIALSPDGRTLYVNQSDPRSPVITAFPVKPDGTVGDGSTFFDTSPLMPGRKGLPDGLKVDERGNLWSSGPGGILVISPTGKLLGLLDTGVPTANCNWGDDGRTLYITADTQLLRIRTLVRGAGWERR
jgi:gluconolactonase